MKRLVLHIVVLLMVAVPSYSQISRGRKPFTYDTVYQRKVNDQTRKRPEINNVAVVADLDKATEKTRIEQLSQEKDWVNYPYREISVECISCLATHLKGFSIVRQQCTAVSLFPIALYSFWTTIRCQQLRLSA